MVCRYTSNYLDKAATVAVVEVGVGAGGGGCFFSSNTVTARTDGWTDHHEHHQTKERTSDLKQRHNSQLTTHSSFYRRYISCNDYHHTNKEVKKVERD